MFTRTTRHIEITVRPEFVPERSNVERCHFFWVYSVTINNTGPHVVQLTDRHWTITDANGHVEEVRGEGVVGEQPLIRPGEAFRYTSGCPLRTPSGFMAGTYRMVEQGGETFEAEIPMFSLDSPSGTRVLN